MNKFSRSKSLDLDIKKINFYINRRKFAKLVAAGTIGFLSTVYIEPALSEYQNAWRYCKKCHAMFFDGFPDKGKCPVEGGHEASGYNFVLLHDVSAPSSILHIHKDVTFRSGVAIGGWYDVALTPQGDISFSGHFHNSGADNYNTTVAVVLMTPDGLAYSVTHQGNTYGTFHSGSRNDDWVINEKNDMIAKNWDTQFSKATWKSTARASSKTLESIQSIVDDLANQLAQAAGKAAVAAVISLL